MPSSSSPSSSSPPQSLTSVPAAATAATTTTKTLTPVLQPTTPFWRRLRLYCLIWLLKGVVSGLVWLTKAGIVGARATRPTYTKRYAVLPDIECRVFIPKTYKAGDRPLPLLIDIHGGGFTVGAPAIDDKDNASFAHTHGFVVVSIGYRLAPTHQFPTAPMDCAALMSAVLDDSELPVDHDKVAVCGYSAGGNLSLTAPQLHGLHDRIKAVVAFYPNVDFVSTVKEKMLTRVPDGKADMLESTAPALNLAYVPVGVNKREPLLSPTYAPRNVLPKHIYLLGCEHDLLCNESEVFADKLAALEKENTQKVVYADAGATGWRQGSIRWELIKGHIHGFNQNPVFNSAERIRTQARAERMRADVARWLKEEVWK